MKLPELMPIDLEASNEELENQVRAIQREAAIWALEEAAKLLDELHAKDTLTNYHGFAANKVRALKGEIE